MRRSLWIKLQLIALTAFLSFPFLGSSQGYKARTWGTPAAYNLNNASNLVAISSYLSAPSDGNVLGLKANGTVVTFGVEANQSPPGLTNVIMVAAGGFHSLALKSDGSVTCWGGESPGGIFTTIGAGRQHSLGVRPDGSVVAWGGANLCYTNYPFPGHSISCGETDVPSSATNVVAVAGGDKHSLALRYDGTVVAWGGNDYGQINVPSNLSNVVAIAAGSYHNLALKSDGTVIGWGNNSAGAATGSFAGSNVVSIAAGGDNSIAIKSDGTVVAWGGGDTNIPPDLTFAVAVTGGYGFYAALVTEAAVYSPYISRHPVPTSQTVVPGSAVIYKVSAIGVPPLTYQWLFNNNPIPGKTNITLQLPDLHWPNSGSYSVIVSNSAGAVVSSPAILNVVTSLDVHLIPRITLGGEIGYDFRLEYINAIGPTNQWMLLDIVSITNNPQFYYDNTALGLPQRFYRLSTTNSP